MYTDETVGDDVDASIAALPPQLLDAFAEPRTALEVSPWTVGRPLVPSNPDGLRVATVGPSGTCEVVFHVLERDRVVPIVQNQLPLTSTTDLARTFPAPDPLSEMGSSSVRAVTA